MLIASYAKINLYLDVLSKRIDGYHEIETVYSTINLHDSLKFVLTKKPIIQIWSNIDELANEQNLVYQIAKRIHNDFNVKTGVNISLTKRIPVAAGLGGGSSNAAMTLIALNYLLGLKMDDSYLNAVAAEYGSDINYFLVGGLALGKNRGEQISPLPETEPLELLLVKPPFGIASKEAYQFVELDKQFYAGDKMWYNKLETGIRARYPEINQIILDLKSMGAAAAIMSGSGSTCIGYFKNKKRQADAKHFFDSKAMWTKIVKTIGRREYQTCFQNLS